ncbi:MAG: sulfatase-like hydrolase/transferase, partial [Acidobacteriia bacterium]|nr:sulfatase-like hydrolase/transferase [Terriglobia bacterium]
WVPTIYETDVSYVVWLLASLIDLTLYAFLGALVGLLAGLAKSASPAKGVVLASALVGVAGAHIGWTHALVHVWVADQEVVARLTTPMVWFATVFAATLFLSRVFWRRATQLFEIATVWPVVTLAKSFVTVAVLLTLGLGAHLVRHLNPLSVAKAASASPPGKPNIVLISLDTVRADHLTPYGYPRATTPHLSKLAERGILFENAISPTSWTLPSHASMLTGLLPHQHGADNFTPLSTGPRTLAEILESDGYETASFNANGYGLAGWGLKQGFEVYDDNSDLIRHNLASMLIGRVAVWPLYLRLAQPNYYFRREAPELNGEVLHWLQRRSNRPYFLFLNYFDAHDPCLPTSPYDKRFGMVSFNAIRRVTFAKGFPLDPPLAPKEKQSLIDGYDNSLVFLDEQVDTLLRSLAASPDWDNTIVIVTSDHGEAFDDHGQYLHGRTLYRELLHVPLILAGPGIPAALRISHLVRTRELFATVLDLALGDSLPLQPFSLRRFWTPGYKPQPRDNLAVSELVPFLPGFTPVKASLMTSEWHYLHDSQGHEELYHLTLDPTENTDLAGDPQYAPIVERLHKSLETRLALSRGPWRGPDYLSALDRPGYSYQRAALFDAGFHNSPLVQGRPVGTAQSLFVANSASPRKPLPQDIDLVNTLPYR